MNVRAYETELIGSPWNSVKTTYALTASKARYLRLLDSREAFPDLTFKDIRVRSLSGPPVTSEAFRNVAEKRGLPFARVGMAIEVDGKRGTIVGHNDSANFDVMFDDGRGPANCHPRWQTRYFDRLGNVLADYTEGRSV